MDEETKALSDASPAVGPGSTPFLARPKEAPRVKVGDALGRYTVRALIGEGGMGEVYAAHDPVLDRLVALKIMRAEVGGESPAARARFQREAQAMARLNHPNVVSVFDVGAVDDRVFVTMELVEGPTLGAWLAETPRGWREVLEVFLQAGRGLTAAHLAGIVHRDFKPSNVIVGDRVRVADFGLARTVRQPDLEPSSATTTLEAGVTHAGQRLGTPAYMAPEQRRGEAADARADQFSFCLTMWEGLHGELPAARPPAPRRADVPGWVNAAVLRGLAEDPDARWPSMKALVAELGRDRGAALRRIGVAAALVLAAGATALAIVTRSGDPCAGAGPQLAAVWDAAARARVAAAFRATGRPYAGETYTRVDAALASWVGGWARSYRGVCEATHVQHAQSEALLDLRMRCLGRAKAEVEALVALLAEADGPAVDRAAEAARTAGDVAPCADVEAIAGAAPLPRDPAARRQLDELRRQQAQVQALQQLGMWTQGLAAGRELVARARLAGHPAPLAQALYTTGSLEQMTGEIVAARDTLWEALASASAARDDALAARTLTRLAGDSRKEVADVVYQMAQAAAARSGNGLELLADLYDRRAWVLQDRGDFQAALPLRFLVLGLYQRALGPESYPVARALVGVGSALDYAGRATEIAPYFERAIAIAEKTLGAEHPNTAQMIHNYGTTCIDAQRADDAIPLLERALAIREKVLGPDGLPVAQTLGALGRARLEQNRFTDAQALLERQKRIYDAQDREPRREGLNREMLGRALLGEGRLLEAHRLFQEAMALGRQGYGDENIRLVQVARVDVEVLLLMDQVGEARATIERALGIEARVLGEDHADRADTFRAYATVLQAERRLPEAIAEFRRALSLWERQYGPDSPALTYTLTGLADALVASGDGRAALVAAERAEAVARLAPPHARGWSRFMHAQALWATGERPRALALARDARTTLAPLAYASRDVARIDRWLAQR